MTSENNAKRSVDDVGRLLQLAGKPRSIDPERMARVKDGVRDHWQQQVVGPRQRRQRFGYGLAAAASLAFVVMMAQWLTPQLDTSATLVQVSRVMGTLTTADGIAVSPGQTLAADAVLTTDARSRAAIDWHHGHSVRLDRGTRLAVTEEGLSLLAGAVYVDSGSERSHPQPLIIETAFGPVRDIGTQYLVRSQDDALVIKVREGTVEVRAAALANPETPQSVSAGYLLQLARGGEVEQQPIAADDEDWNWAVELAEFELDGKTLDEFLRWTARENGWTLDYDSLRTRRTAEDSTLHGDIRGLPTREALQNVLTTYGFDFRVDQATLRIIAEDN